MTRSAKLAAAALVLAAAAPVAVQSAGGERPSAQEVFTTRCAYCHDAGGWGTRSLSRRLPADQAELLKRTNLAPAYTAYVVRRGIGSMPQFTPTELTDAELEALANWLEDRN